MSPCLKHCPDEIIETIVMLLDLGDIRSLRQTCQSLAAKTTQGHFKSYYYSKRVDITQNALREFVFATQLGRLGCLVQELVLVGLTNGTKGRHSKPQHGQMDMEFDLLTQAFKGIAANKKGAQLLSLSLEVAVLKTKTKQRLLPAAVDGGVWKFVWQAAAHTFHTTIRALAASRLLLQNLDVFNDHQSQSCSLACDELGHVNFQAKGLAISLSNLKSLSISLSDRIIKGLPTASTDFSQPPNEEDIRKAKTKAMAWGNFVGLTKLLQLVHSLDSLEIHYFRLDTARHLLRDSHVHHERVLKQVAKSKKLPKLKQCRLRGIYVDDGDLLAFIQRTDTRRLFMENVTISGGSFRSIFDYCTNETTAIEELCLDDLVETHNTLNFPPLDEVGHGLGTTSLRRVGAEVKRPIIYHSHHVIYPDSPYTRELRQKRRLEYGPPRIL